MTISIGLIPNAKTVMLIQDSEVSYERLGFTQDIYRKIKGIDGNSVTGVIGIPVFANEIIELVRGGYYRNGQELSDKVEQSYHSVRGKHLHRGVLAKYGLNDIKEVVSPLREVQIDPAVRDEVLSAVNNSKGFFNLDLMLAMNYDVPLLNVIGFPGNGYIYSGIKDYCVSGSGTIMAIDRMGEELNNYRWERELKINDGLDVLLKAGKAAEKHTGVGGPFEVVYLTRHGKETKIERPDQKKINMVMYLFDLNIKEDVMREAINKMRDDKINESELADYIKTNTGVGIEFDRYFDINGKK